MESNKSLTAFVLFVTAVVCFGFGAATRGNGAVSLRGSVVDVVATRDLPAYVNRWCLIRDGRSPDSTNVAIVEYGEGRSRHLYAYPQPPSSNLAAHDLVSSDIDTCSIAKIAPRANSASTTIAGSQDVRP